MGECIEAEPGYPSGATGEEGRAEIRTWVRHREPAPASPASPRASIFQLLLEGTGPDGERSQRSGGGDNAPGIELSSSVRESGSAMLITFITVTAALSCSHHIAEKTEARRAC